MPPAYLYHPIVFYLITILAALVLGPMTAYVSSRKETVQFQLPLLFLCLCVPCITSITMIYVSNSEILIDDFWDRLMNFKISFPILMVIMLFMPCIVLLATQLSLLFGYSQDQFSFSHDFTVMKGWAILGTAIPLVIAPIIEEIGWRGYGVDSIRAFYNLFTTSVIFGLLWAVWHLPAFFIKGYYHNQLWDLGITYVINFFVSVFVIAFLMNWVYYKTGRSIPAVILFHSMLNFSLMLLRTEPFTKCLVTVLVFLSSIILILYDWQFFFIDAVVQ